MVGEGAGRWLPSALAAGLALALGLGPELGRAQDEPAGEPHPAHIHSGTCDDLGDVVYPLSDVIELPRGAIGVVAAAGTPVADDATGERSVGIGDTTVDASLEEILADQHAVNVHLSADEMGAYIACGTLGSDAMGGSAASGVVLFMDELEGTGYQGIAMLDGAGDQTEVSVILFGDGETVGAEATPEGTPTAGDAGGAVEEVAVEIRDFAFAPDPVTVPAGGTVTWTNRDPDRHTATARGDRDALQSGTLDEGETYSQTFDEPGTYEYFCEFHAGMRGTVEVE